MELLLISRKRTGKEYPGFSEISPTARQDVPFQGVRCTLARKLSTFFSWLSNMNCHIDIEFTYNYIQLCTMSVQGEYIRWYIHEVIEISSLKNTVHFKQRFFAGGKPFSSKIRTRKWKAALKLEAVLVENHRKAHPVCEDCAYGCVLEIQRPDFLCREGVQFCDVSEILNPNGVSGIIRV